MGRITRSRPLKPAQPEPTLAFCAFIPFVLYRPRRRLPDMGEMVAPNQTLHVTGAGCTASRGSSLTEAAPGKSAWSLGGVKRKVHRYGAFPDRA
jgi:hypothetical protein